MTTELNLGGMRLVSQHGDVDIYLNDEYDSFTPDIRLQRADLDEIIAFLKQARKRL